MSISHRIDESLWPYVSRTWLYYIVLAVYGMFLAGSVWSARTWALVCDPIAMVMVIVAMQSRERYLIWRSRTHRPRPKTCRPGGAA